MGKPGAALVPVDPNYPAGRIAHMVSVSGGALRETHAAYRDSRTDNRLLMLPPSGALGRPAW
ncbi:hypothetical protein [Nocardia cyriacigeorgica]|uniref:hypothetical protein n=1 Tax=Nocardia cyriacigeorgica TaxID=135487 RepID=UPI002453ADF7|nr:hypothetical protein [Nocardia cyriacigeorgica]